MSAAPPAPDGRDDAPRAGGDVARLQAMLAVAGAEAGAGGVTHLSVEGRGTLAVLVPRAHPFAVSPALRRWLAAAAQACGFSHVALEVHPVPDDDAALPGHHAP